MPETPNTQPADPNTSIQAEAGPAAGRTESPDGLEGSCEDPRLKAAGYFVCGSGANTEWHFRRPDGTWADRFPSEEAAVAAALAEVESLPVRAPRPDLD